MNFDIDAIDDLKIACEEAYLMAIGCCLGSCQAITFLGREDSLEITFKKLIKSAAKNQDKLKKQQDYCLFIIKAVVDKVEKLSSSPDYYDLKLTKYLKNTSRG
jgi:chemotaxis receptor (MCP) glutamine deamidase CheD